MRIVSYNVNGLRPRLSSPPRTLAAFLDSLDADIICLQETKLARHEMTADIAVADGYESFFSCTRTVKKGRIGYSGVATFCRAGITSSSTSPVLPLAADEGFTGLLHRTQNGELEAEKWRVGCYEEVAKTELSTQELLHLDNEGRCLITDHGSFVLFNLYCPRVSCGDVERLEFKVNFFHTLQRRWEALLKQNRRVIAVGDFNISPYRIDSCAPGPDFDENVCRKWLRSLLKEGGGQFLDVFRFFHQDRREAYTCWSQSSGAEEFNFGTRIDLIIAAGRCNHEVAEQSNGGDEGDHGFVNCEVADSDILSQFRRLKPDSHPRWQGGRSLKLEGSDHAPIVVQLREQSPIDPHETPPLAARFMPEIRGRQQNLVSFMKRKSPSLGTQDTETKIESSSVLSASRVAGSAKASPKEATSGICTESEASSDIWTSPSPLSGGVVGKSKKWHSQFASSATVDRKKRSVQKSGSQQKDLRAFFTSKSSTPSERGGHSEALVYVKFGEGDSGTAVLSQGSVQGCEADPDIGDVSVCTDNSRDWDGNSIVSTPDSGDPNSRHRLLEASEQIGLNREDAFCKYQIELDRKGPRETDLEYLTQLEQARAAEESVAANAAWIKIKQKMAQAVPLCKGHREPCVGRVVKKPGPNKGRGFYVCARAEGPPSNKEARCDHFEWAASFKKGQKSAQ